MHAHATVHAIQDSWQDAATVSIIVLVSYLAVIWIAAVLWTYRDIVARTNEPTERIFSVAVVALFSVPGLVLHLLLRPRQTLEERFDRQLEAQAMLHDIQEIETCSRCRRPVGADFVACPYCRAELRTACRACGGNLASDWVMCPYCTADRTPAAATASPASARVPSTNGKRQRSAPARPPLVAARPVASQRARP